LNFKLKEYFFLQGVLLTNESKKSDGLDKLFKQIFHIKQYNNMLRPHDTDGITYLKTELKLLQIDLDEKYQKLRSTVWIEMVRIRQQFIFNIKLLINKLIYLYN